MKKITMLLFAVTISTFLLAQKDKQKNKETASQNEGREIVLGKEKSKSSNDNAAGKTNNDKDNSGKAKGNNDNKIWDGTKDKDGGGPKASKNQPAKVRSAFAKDYPNASNVSWSKYRGDWTATFNNTIIRSTAVYHANGQRKDTRTVIEQPQLPKRISDIFKKKPAVQMSDIVKIEVPSTTKNIFRIKT